MDNTHEWHRMDAERERADERRWNEYRFGETITKERRMTKDEAIVEVCSIVALAYKSIGYFSEPSDGFCSKCNKKLGGNWNYQNSGTAIDYVRNAVVEQLKRDGLKIAEGFDPVTGKEIL